MRRLGIVALCEQTKSVSPFAQHSKSSAGSDGTVMSGRRLRRDSRRLSQTARWNVETSASR
jgi:hypothetical protein